jgi:hypothetical protein
MDIHTGSLSKIRWVFRAGSYNFVVQNHSGLDRYKHGNFRFTFYVLRFTIPP